jgi:hypothetical protein
LYNHAKAISSVEETEWTDVKYFNENTKEKYKKQMKILS